MSDNEGKPEEKPEAPILVTLKVKDQQGQEIQFKAKAHMKLEKLMNAFEKNHNVDLGTYRFFFDGSRIQNTDTPQSLGMEDEDVIEAFIQQVGGGGYTLLG
ncbi:hypothetical protein HYFRA_00011790 [Hymenoscyphus fraxineus]|uniref:Ubiquitin-like domain-containing protein n=1 Tax=Hymenoscyphus fraxineus TaxID=746836 RepID=A0A9N9L4A3_9HELO|nr:hypothetical protein HYFRA_00011790 [Hymenoscyphus fraxineus]